MRKRWISLLLTAVMVFGLCGPMGALVPEAGATNVSGEVSGVTWELSDGTLTLGGDGMLLYANPPWKDYRTEIKKVVVEYGITGVSASAFSGCANLTSVELSSSVTQILDDAFAYCTALKTIKLPTSLELIGNRAFKGSGLQSLELPGSVRFIWSEAFAYCDGLREVILPDTLHSINDQAFYGCKNLQTVDLPAISIMGNQAFGNCPSLKTVYWPKYMTSSTGYFIDCNPLTVYYEGTEEEWNNISSWRYDEYVPAGSTIYFENGSAQPEPEPEPEPEPKPEPEPEEPAVEIPAPTLQSVANEETGILVQWSADDLGSSVAWWLESGFYILRKSGSGSFEKIATVEDPDATSYLDTDVEVGKEYTYTVQQFSGSQTSQYDRNGLKIKRITQSVLSGNYPNDELGWSVANNVANFGRSADAPIAIERYQEALGIDLGDQLYTLMSQLGKNGGYCFGLSLLAAAQYNGQIDLSILFSDPDFIGQSKDKKLSNAAITSIVKSDTSGKYYAKMENDQLVNIIERAHLMQYDKDVKGAQVYSKQKDYSGLLSYLLDDNSNPILVTLSGSNAYYHAVLTYPGIAPEKISDNEYKIFLYDPNVPQIGSDSTLVPYAEDDMLSPYYTNGMSYLILNADNGDWSYYNPNSGSKPVAENGYYNAGMSFDWNNKGNHFLHHETIQFFDVSKVPDRVFKTVKGTITGVPVNLLVIENILQYSDAKPLIIEDSKKNTSILNTAKGSSGSGLELAIAGDYVENYTLCGEDNQNMLLWLSDDCAEVSVQSSGIEAVYLSGETMFSIAAAGGAEITLNPDDASVTYRAEEGAVVELGVQRNSYNEKDAVSFTISTELDADDSLTFTLREDGVPKISGPAGQRYELTYSTYNGGGTTPEATVEEIMEFLGEEPSLSFADVPSNAYYADAVQWAVEQGITTGTSARTFSPDEPCTRAQVVTFIWRTLGLDELSSRSTENPFRDVPSNAYYCDPVLWAAENDITTGTSATTFSPDDACTRAQVVTFLWRVDFPPKYYDAGQSFRDVRVSDYYWYPVQWAVERNITTGTSATTFSPNETCTRAQVVTFLYRDFA